MVTFLENDVINGNVAGPSNKSQNPDPEISNLKKGFNMQSQSEAELILMNNETSDSSRKSSENEDFSSGSSNDYVPDFDCSDSDEEINPGGEIQSPLHTAENSITRRKPGGRQKQDQPTKKRKRDPKNWKRNVRKSAKDAGKDYLSVTGLIKPKKNLKPPCTCRKKCWEKINENERINIFEQFYKLPVESQNQYLSDCVDEFEKKSQRLRTQKSKSRRNFSRNYFLKCKGIDEKIEVCQTMFLNTLSVTLMKIRTIVTKKRQLGTNMCPPDGRGRHGNQKKLSTDAKQSVIEHINMFPAYESHYSRNRTQKKYLSGDLSISKCHRLYLTHCEENNIIQRVNEAMYRKIFVENFNLSFRKPKNDTCDKCDKFNLIIQASTNEEKKAAASSQYEMHLKLAEASYQEKKKDKENSICNEKYAFVCFDLEKCLPTPYLQNNVSFYKRSLWTFNLTFYSVINQQTTAACCVWNETIAKRGGEEIASCIRKHLLDLPEQVEEISLFSDSCTGQNRNIYVATMYLHFLAEDLNEKPNMRLKVINQKYLQPGHTHMEADTIHATIEKEKKRTALKIDLPRDWANLIRSIGRRHPIKVIEMEQKQFISFKTLISQKYVHRKENINKEKVSWLRIKWLQFRKENPDKVFYKYSFDENEEFKIIDFSRKKGRRSNVNLPLTPLYSRQLALPANKLADLQSLLPYIHESSHHYYQTLTGNDTHDPISDSNEDSEVDEN